MGQSNGAIQEYHHIEHQGDARGEAILWDQR